MCDCEEEEEQYEAPMIGRPCPPFKGEAVFPSLEFKDIELSQFKKKWVVLFTFPLDFTFVCPTEIIAFSDSYDKFKKIKCEVIGMSTDSVYAHLAWIGVQRHEGGIGNIKYPLIGDLGGVISRQFGFFMEDAGHDLRGTVIIDPDGIIQHISMNQPDVGRNVDEVLRLVQGYQFARKHGEVCPAQWNQGDPTIKPDPKKSKKYFEKHGDEVLSRSPGDQTKSKSCNLDMFFTMETLVQRLEQNKKLKEGWETEKRQLESQLSYLFAKKVAIDLCRKDMIDRINNMQYILGYGSNTLEDSNIKINNTEFTKVNNAEVIEGDDDGEEPAQIESIARKTKKTRGCGKSRGKKRVLHDIFS